MAKQSYQYRSINGLTSAIFNEQSRLIEEKYGKEQAYNLGWGVDGDDTSVSSATKVYASDKCPTTMILSTAGSIGDSVKDFSHEWSEYSPE